MQIGELGKNIIVTTGGFNFSLFGGGATSLQIKVQDPNGITVVGSPFPATASSDNLSAFITTGTGGGQINPAIPGEYTVQLIITYAGGQVLKTPEQLWLVTPSL